MIYVALVINNTGYIILLIIFIDYIDIYSIFRKGTLDERYPTDEKDVFYYKTKKNKYFSLKFSE